MEEVVGVMWGRDQKPSMQAASITEKGRKLILAWSLQK